MPSLMERFKALIGAGSSSTPSTKTSKGWFAGLREQWRKGQEEKRELNEFREKFLGFVKKRFGDEGDPAGIVGMMKTDPDLIKNNFQKMKLFYEIIRGLDIPYKPWGKGEQDNDAFRMLYAKLSIEFSNNPSLNDNPNLVTEFIKAIQEIQDYKQGVSISSTQVYAILTSTKDSNLTTFIPQLAALMPELKAKNIDLAFLTDKNLNASQKIAQANAAIRANAAILEAPPVATVTRQAPPVATVTRQAPPASHGRAILHAATEPHHLSAEKPKEPAAPNAADTKTTKLKL